MKRDSLMILMAGAFKYPPSLNGQHTRVKIKILAIAGDETKLFITMSSQDYRFVIGFNSNCVFILELLKML